MFGLSERMVWFKHPAEDRSEICLAMASRLHFKCPESMLLHFCYDCCYCCLHCIIHETKPSFKGSHKMVSLSGRQLAISTVSDTGRPVSCSGRRKGRTTSRGCVQEAHLVHTTLTPYLAMHYAPLLPSSQVDKNFLWGG